MIYNAAHVGLTYIPSPSLSLILLLRVKGASTSMIECIIQHVRFSGRTCQNISQSITTKEAFQVPTDCR